MKKLRILVVDDDPKNREILATILVYEGYAELPIVTASDGETAINMLKVNYFNLVMTDMNMPKKNGLEVTEFVKRCFPKIKVIMLTGFHEEISRKGVTLPDRILRKPYKIQEIRDAIAELFP